MCARDLLALEMQCSWELRPGDDTATTAHLFQTECAWQLEDVARYRAHSCSTRKLTLGA